MIEILKEFILKNSNTLNLPSWSSRKITALLIPGSVGVQGKMVFLFFCNREKTPFLIAKVTRDRRYIRYLKNEYVNLKKLRGLLSSELKQSLPEPLYFGNLQSDTVLLETPILGKRAEKLIRDDDSLGSNRYLDIVLRWIEKFNFFTRTETLMREEVCRELFYKPLQDFMTNFELNSEEMKLVTREMERLNEIINTRIPLVSIHGELWPGNVFLQDSKLGFIDWECSQFKGLPFFDFFTFFVSYFRVLFNSGHFIPVKEIFSVEGLPLKILKGYINRYSEAVGIDRGLCRLFFVLYLVKFSNIEYEFRMADIAKGYLRDSYIYGIQVPISQAVKRNLRYFNFFKSVVENKLIGLI